MSTAELQEKSLLPHHEQKPLCTTRLPYRRGRKLTAVKVYTINTESNHLLVFGVPALNLRQEAKSLFLRFGNLKQFYVSKDHPGELFTETYHANFEKIQSARLAKRMLDTKSFYGGSLHVCYAPELETIEETRLKLSQRIKDVTYRLKNIDKEKKFNETESNIEETRNVDTIKVDVEYAPINNEVPEPKNKLNMGEKNTIYLKRKNEKKELKRKAKKNIAIKKFKPNTDVKVIDFVSTERETLSNINDALNYNKFGNEDIRIVTAKPVNTIKFNIKR